MSTAHDAHHDDHGHGHHGSRFIQHHYDDAQHQFDSGKLGIWLFLAQEVLFFSALFVAYVLYRVHHGELYSYAHKWLDVKYGAINTAVLIFSSLTAAWAVRCAQLNQRKGLILCIVTTIACACTFMGIKYIEYSHKYHEQILFGRYFDPCVSPGGYEMITKKNECPGSNDTVIWDAGAGKATEGCYEASSIDQNHEEPDVQADCKVFAVKGEHERGADGKMEFKEKSRNEITEHCHQWNLEEEEARKASGQKEEPEKFPCWRPSYQPAVCPDLTDANARAKGTPGRPQVGILVIYGDHEEREDVLIKAECKPAPKETHEIDILGTPEHPTQLGKSTVLDHGHVLTTHEQHEIESMGPPPEHTNMFFTIYFAMTGLHGIHVIAGIIVFLWLLIRSLKGHFTPDYFGPVDYAALYWHIVDLIWIFLFPLLYLIH
ncbi:MAG TPA: cytochrome c oxidase subunit 3 [Kofleriaceae bacterium]|nr:cytochrome c oxidase subunit 3 [Kofleriaceae bacterium]